MPVPELLHRLLTAPGPTGYETAPAAIWCEAASSFAEVSGDTLGSSVARVGGTSEGPLLALLGHIDEIGLAVTHVDEDGFIAFLTIGGQRAEVLRAQRVELLTKNGPVPGVVAKKGVRRRKAEDKDKVTELEELFIDIGARDRARALELVRPGDAAVVAAEPLQLADGLLVSRALDNRLGAYVALEAARRVAESGGAPGDVAAIAAVQEEVGDFGGARTTVFAVEPEVVVAIDVTGATDVPEGDPKQYGEVKIGGGPIIQRGSTVNPRVSELLVETAEAEGIEYGINVSAGVTATDMDAAHLSRAGVPAGLVSIPTRYIHTPTELVSLDDVDAAIRLVAGFAKRLEPGLSFAR
ncbi:MAG TPA: M20/M25/M40 family metallo-hydrolase [Gaiellaceae bacterium]